jgi:hypothetical protein
MALVARGTRLFLHGGSIARPALLARSVSLIVPESARPPLHPNIQTVPEADTCAVPALQRFAKGLRDDLDAVCAGLTEIWSNGPTEGFVHKLKLLKRQAYGRADFDLLRQRMIAAA